MTGTTLAVFLVVAAALLTTICIISGAIAGARDRMTEMDSIDRDRAERTHDNRI